ncbi:hypothetical protein [Streptomyces viridochromogenes]|uniref:hypothetical protein n=1 Tax=Streptomyces viridochromogenes TaxID=1938 RepID=UPI000B150D3C|nr:hypothetical protein [Streptomyces viridochromogenes]
MSSEADAQEQVALVEVTTNYIVAAVAVFSLLFAGVGSFLQWMATKDQLQQSGEARARERKQQAALFDVRTQDGRLYLRNYSHHTVRGVDVFFSPAYDSKNQLWFRVPNVAPCTAVTYTFNLKQKDGKPILAKLDFANLSYQDWEGRYWSMQADEGLVWVDSNYREELRKDTKLLMSWTNMVNGPRKYEDLPDCSGS